jgi:hypothetical protein
MAHESYPLAVKSSCKQITDQQRARITENFKAAKALLARKRPPQPFTSPVHHEIPYKKSSAKDISETTESCFFSVPESRYCMLSIKYKIANCKVYAASFALY